MSRPNAEALGRGTDMALGFVTPVGGGSATLRMAPVLAGEGRLVPALAGGGRLVSEAKPIVVTVTQTQAAATSVVTHAAVATHAATSSGTPDGKETGPKKTDEKTTQKATEKTAKENKVTKKSEDHHIASNKAHKSEIY